MVWYRGMQAAMAHIRIYRRRAARYVQDTYFTSFLIGLAIA